MADTIIRILSLVLIFGTAFLMTELLVRLVRARSASTLAINQRLRMIEQGSDRLEIVARLRKDARSGFGQVPGPLGRMLASVERTVRASGVSMTARQFVTGMLAATSGILLLLIIGAAAMGFGITLALVELVAAFSLAVGIGLPILFLSHRAQKRKVKIQAQFPNALDIFVRGLKAGHPIASALALLAHEMEDPIGSEFGLITDEVSYGADLRDALQEMADRWELQDMQMFVVSLAVQHETGGNLAEILENLSRVIRERAAMFMKVRALSSEGRMSAKVLTALPILTFILVFLINPEFYLRYSQEPAFIFGFTGLIILYSVGVIVIRRMIDLKV